MLLYLTLQPRPQLAVMLKRERSGILQQAQDYQLMVLKLIDWHASSTQHPIVQHTHDKY